MSDQEIVWYKINTCRLSIHFFSLYYLVQISGDVITKATAYDRLMDENVEIKMQLRTTETEKDKYRLEMERVRRERLRERERERERGVFLHFSFWLV